MPEGHTIHRLAAAYGERFGGGDPVRARSPQGKFADGAALVDGQPLIAAEAHGKHLFLGFTGVGWVHVHLGLYGKVAFGDGPAPAPVGQVRLRLATAEHWADLRGPARCALVTDAEKRAVTDRLGPDPLRAGEPGQDAERAWPRVTGRRVAIAELLLDQRVIAGPGNIYRAEVLFRRGIDPHRPGRGLTRREWDGIWDDLVALMREGVRAGRIDTVRPEHTPEAMGRPPRQDEHGGEVYVYRRAGAPCHVCGTPVRTAVLAARNLFWCPVCQPR
ncbi:Fpg/Nei family DNA glycosylase [Streptomyces radicis]|uniref:Endonuclease 8 1 n=1 Tax=Streptomyces radicis TaxID=1750517 RepID=A0A3A9WCH9_9ACTN|nr:DNA-formamidopyrimidine glycosylase family protein [Streptomyces radicis]RKN11051.1 Fpg/Nei family DNA glycosylase [Streptomyces radicis]RKN25314.1 Fpg/Nei family DNA glycosylase [Streptomyces radicis]